MSLALFNNAPDFIVAFNQASERTINDSLAFLRTLFKVGDLKKDSDHIFLRFSEELKKVIPSEERDAIAKKIIANLPDNQWTLANYEEINKVFTEVFDSGKQKEIEKVLKDVFKDAMGIKSFLSIYFEKLAIKSNEQITVWEDILLDKRNKVENIEVVNEVILTYRDFLKINEKKQDDLQWLLIALAHTNLKNLRIIQIMNDYQAKRYDHIIKISNWLRQERYDMKFDLGLV